LKLGKGVIKLFILIVIPMTHVVAGDSQDPFIQGAKVHYMVRVKYLRSANDLSTNDMFCSMHFTSYVQGWLDMAEYLVPEPEQWIEGSSTSPSSYQEIVDEVSTYIVNNPKEIENMNSRDIVFNACIVMWPSFSAEIVKQSLKAAKESRE
jgi:hypothetical protein